MQIPISDFDERTLRAHIAKNLAGPGFRQLWADTPSLASLDARREYMKSKNNVDTPVGIMPAYLRAAMGAATPSLLLFSRDGIAKTKGNHPGDVSPEDLLMVQKILDGDTIHQQTELEWLGFARDEEGKLWAAGWKLTQNRHHAYLRTIHRARESRLNQTEKRFGLPLTRGQKK